MVSHRFSRLAGAWRVGDDFFTRAGVASGEPPPRGLVDRLEDLAVGGALAAHVPAEVRAFFEDPSSLELRVRSRWQRGFRLAWRAMRAVMGAVGQLYLPLEVAHVRTRMVALDGAREGRADARGVVRTYVDTGEVFQVFAYGVAAVEGAALMSVAIPLPGGHLAGLLRLEAGPAAVTLTSRRASPDDATGVWFVTRWLSLRLPFEETLRFWSATSPDAPADDRAWSDATLVARHEQRLFGALVVEHAYVFRPLR
jgi:hypothetical protein